LGRIGSCKRLMAGRKKFKSRSVKSSIHMELRDFDITLILLTIPKIMKRSL
jgi:hypothetical protein